MLWSVVPESVVFDGFGDSPVFWEHQVENCPCRVRVGSDGVCSIEAVCSTDPRDFLNKNLSPGQRIFLGK